MMWLLEDVLFLAHFWIVRVAVSLCVADETNDWLGSTVNASGFAACDQSQSVIPGDHRHHHDDNPIYRVELPIFDRTGSMNPTQLSTFGPS